jgi:hypothetical protein
MEPILHRVFEGCHLTRDIPALLTQGGFQIEQMETAYLASFPKSWAYCWWGIALPQVRQEVSTMDTVSLPAATAEQIQLEDPDGNPVELFEPAS